MQQIMIFLSQHWVLALLFLVVLVAVVIVEIMWRIGTTRSLGTAELIHAINRQQATVIDIRSAKAYQQGHITQAINVEASSGQSVSKRLQKYKNKQVVVYCDDAVHSATFAKQLLQQGFTQVNYLTGGITAWKNDNLPLKRKS